MFYLNILTSEGLPHCPLARCLARPALSDNAPRAKGGADETAAGGLRSAADMEPGDLRLLPCLGDL